MNLSNRFSRVLCLTLWTPVLLLAGACTAPEAPESAAIPALETYADTVAFRAFESWGGPEAWARLPYLGFEFAFESPNGERRPGRKHLWNRRNGDYRIEWRQGLDSAYVALFNVNSREGHAYLNGHPLDDSLQAALVRRAYAWFINDTYWLMMPVKMFDEGVKRAFVADSSGAGKDVLHLSFGNVGLTPGDQYWVWVDRASGRVTHWCYVLQGSGDRPPTHWDWTGYQTFETPAGPLQVATRKEGAPGALLTDHVAMPEAVPADLFSDPNPRL